MWHLSCCFELLRCWQMTLCILDWDHQAFGGRWTEKWNKLGSSRRRVASAFFWWVSQGREFFCCCFCHTCSFPPVGWPLTPNFWSSASGFAELTFSPDHSVKHRLLLLHVVTQIYKHQLSKSFDLGLWFWIMWLCIRILHLVWLVCRYLWFSWILMCHRNRYR